MFFVYSGEINCDNCDGEAPTHSIKEFEDEGDVIEYKKEFEEEIVREDSHFVIFRIFEGKELKMKPKKIVNSWEFES